MNDYQYILEPYGGMKTRHTCPRCGKKKKFTRFFDKLSGEHLPYQYGRCERLESCKYFLDPYKDGYAKEQKGINQGFPKVPSFQNSPPTKPQTFTWIPKEILQGSLQGYEKNTFVLYLNRILGESSTQELIKRFKIGTSNHWPGSTVFWIIDEQDNICGGQVVLFDSKGNTSRFKALGGGERRCNSWVHIALGSKLKRQKKALPEWLVSYRDHSPKFPCLFGLPQLKKEPLNKPIAIVEAAKTAIIATAYFPQYIWMAVGSLSNLNEGRLKSLEGRKITLFPDKGAYKFWKEKVDKLKHIGQIIISDLLERKGAIHGSDLADYLIQYKPEDFRKPRETKLNPTIVYKNPHEVILEQMIQKQPLVGELTKTFNLTLQQI